MTTNLARAADELEIRRVLARYCRGLDRLDEKLVESVFWPAGGPQVYCDGVFKGTAQGWISCAFERGRSDLSTAHMLHQSLIEIDGDVAEVETYFTLRYVYNEDDGVTIMVVVGRYADVFEKRADIWKIAHRAIILDAPRHFDRQSAPTATARPIGRRDDDPSFQLRRLGGEATPPANR
jgi:hypothetical protein